jgi:hypothetical protein
MVSFTPLPLCPRYTLHRPQSRSERHGEDKILDSTGTRICIGCSLRPSVVHCFKKQLATLYTLRVQTSRVHPAPSVSRRAECTQHLQCADEQSAPSTFNVQTSRVHPAPSVCRRAECTQHLQCADEQSAPSTFRVQTSRMHPAPSVSSRWTHLHVHLFAVYFTMAPSVLPGASD